MSYLGKAENFFQPVAQGQIADLSTANDLTPTGAKEVILSASTADVYLSFIRDASASNDLVIRSDGQPVRFDVPQNMTISLFSSSGSVQYVSIRSLRGD
ncbi:hypothetical protein [Myxosarcina sp. GI1(2024)]